MTTVTLNRECGTQLVEGLQTFCHHSLDLRRSLQRNRVR